MIHLSKYDTSNRFWPILIWTWCLSTSKLLQYTSYKSSENCELSLPTVINILFPPESSHFLNPTSQQNGIRQAASGPSPCKLPSLHGVMEVPGSEKNRRFASRETPPGFLGQPWKIPRHWDSTSKNKIVVDQIRRRPENRSSSKANNINRFSIIYITNSIAFVGYETSPSWSQW